jgi:hypothetical protein
MHRLARSMPMAGVARYWPMPLPLAPISFHARATAADSVISRRTTHVREKGVALLGGGVRAMPR